MSFGGVNINKINGGLGTSDTGDRVTVLICGAGAIGETLAIKHAYQLLQLSDAEALGITSVHDDQQNRLDHYHISEVFRLAPETSLYLIAVVAATKVSDLKNDAALLTALRSIDNLNTIACVGLAADVAAGETHALQVAIVGAQLLVDELAKDHIYIDAIILEGLGGYLAATIATNLNLRELDSPNVSVVIGQDSNIAALKAQYAAHAAVGSAVGMLLARAIHENLGSVDIEVKPSARKSDPDYSLTDIKSGRFLKAALSDGTPYNELTIADQKQLDTLGYIYIGGFSGYAGFFFSNSHTCTLASGDYSFIERNCIWNKAAKIIRKTLIPRIRSKVEADPKTGYIKKTTITHWSNLVTKSLERMITAGNCAAFDIYISEKQAAVSTQPFSVKCKIVADGIAHEFDVNLGFTNKI